jgi:hypothetical protein
MEQAIKSFDPDWILVSSEDFGQARLRTAIRISPQKTIYLAHTPQFFPFGPESFNQSKAGATTVARAAATIVISEFMQAYCQRFLQHPVLLAHPPVYGPGPFPNYGECNGGFVTMINPCDLKGKSIFLSIASRCQDLRFAALPGWGTTSRDISDLGMLGVRILRPCRNIDEILSNTKILVVPSLWQEGFGLVVVEAMLRGIPVLASNLGGLVEAKLGTSYIFPVNGIEKYTLARNELLLPIPEIPNQDVQPWISAILDLEKNVDLYRSASIRARNAAHIFVKNIYPDAFESILVDLLMQKPQ